MKYQRFLGSALFISIAIFALAGCGPSVRVPITRPAEINLKGINKIAIGEIKGNIGQSVADLITSRLFESGRFEVVDRENLDRLMSEHRLSLAGVIDKDTAAQVGKLSGASALIFGNSNVNYNQRSWRSKLYQNKDGSTYRFFYKEGKAKMNTNLRVVDLATGKILAVKSISEVGRSEVGDKNRWPEDVDRQAVISKAAHKTVNVFMKMIAPYTVYVSVNFESTKTPAGESGVKFAKNGMWAEALEQFKLAAKSSPNRAEAWYNLGLGYEYNYEYDEAIKALKKANQIKPSSKYIGEITSVKRLEAEQQKLAQQK